jgi:hypothetical protein
VVPTVTNRKDSETVPEENFAQPKKFHTQRFNHLGDYNNKVMRNKGK